MPPPAPASRRKTRVPPSRPCNALRLLGLRVHLINPSELAFGVAVITPRWLYVLAAATGSRWGDPHLVDETLEHVDPAAIAPGDVVGIGIHTGNALRGYAIGHLARERG